MLISFKAIIKDNLFLLESVREFKFRFIMYSFFSCISGILDGISILAVFPVLSLIQQETLESKSLIHKKTMEIFNSIGLELNLENLILGILFLMVSKILIQLAINLYINSVQFEIMTSYREKLLFANLNANWLYFTSRSSGKLVNIINTDTKNAAQAFTLSCNIFAILFQILVYLTSAFFISFYLTNIIFAIGILLFLSLYFLLTKTRKLGELSTKNLNEFSKKFIEILQNIKPLIVMGQVKKIQSNLHKNILELKGIYINIGIIKKVLQAIQEMALVITVLLLLFIVFKLNLLVFEQIVVLSILCVRGMGYMSQLQKQFSLVSQISYPYKLVKQTIKNAKSKIEDNFGQKEINNLKSIYLKNIYFKYSNKKIIENVSLKINNPKFLGLYGKSGIGKTTLVDLISGIINPDKGNIYINGINLNHINKEKWRLKIGYVPQETILLNDTLFNNIALDNQKLKNDDVIESMRLAGLSDFMSENDNYLNITLGEGGRKVSGGIRQRISLARALIRKPMLLILDEATSSLDDKTEKKIIQTITKLKKKMIIIAISHTKNIIKNSNISYKLINGELIADEKS